MILFVSVWQVSKHLVLIYIIYNYIISASLSRNQPIPSTAIGIQKNQSVDPNSLYFHLSTFPWVSLRNRDFRFSSVEQSPIKSSVHPKSSVSGFPTAALSQTHSSSGCGWSPSKWSFLSECPLRCSPLTVWKNLPPNLVNRLEFGRQLPSSQQISQEPPSMTMMLQQILLLNGSLILVILLFYVLSFVGTVLQWDSFPLFCYYYAIGYPNLVRGVSAPFPQSKF